MTMALDVARLTVDLEHATHGWAQTCHDRDRLLARVTSLEVLVARLEARMELLRTNARRVCEVACPRQGVAP